MNVLLLTNVTLLKFKQFQHLHRSLILCDHRNQRNLISAYNPLAVKLKVKPEDTKLANKKVEKNNRSPDLAKGSKRILQ